MFWLFSQYLFQKKNRSPQSLNCLIVFICEQILYILVRLLNLFIDFDGFMIAFDCLLNSTHILKCNPNTILYICIVWVDFYGCVVAVDRLIVSAETIECCTEVIMSDCIVWVEFEGCVVAVDRLIVFAETIECIAEVEMNF